MGFRFEKLKIGQLAFEFDREISNMVKGFPKDELFILTSHIKRAVDSIVLNINNGSTLQPKTEFKRFPVIANRSALEVVACLYLSIQRKYINESIFDDKYQKYEKLVAKIQALIKPLDNSDNGHR